MKINKKYLLLVALVSFNTKGAASGTCFSYKVNYTESVFLSKYYLSETQFLHLSNEQNKLISDAPSGSKF